MKKTVLAFIAWAIAVLATAQPTYSLEQILDSARQNNVALRNGQRDIQAAGEQRREAYTKYFPTVSAMGGWFNSAKSLISAEVNVGDALPASLVEQLPAEAVAALQTPFGINLVKNGFVGGIAAVQPLYAGGRIVNSNKLAKLGEDVSRLRLHQSQDEVERTAELYFWQIVALQEKLRTLDAVERMLADIHKDVDVAVGAGVTLRNDLLQVELRQNDVESNKLKLHNGLDLLHMLLAQYCGLQDTAFALTYNAEAQSPLSLRQDHDQALPATTEYQLLEKNVEAAKLQEKITFGENLPSVGLGVGYSYNNIISGRSNATLFATVSIPISGWWGGKHAVQRKKIAYRQALDERQDKAQLLLIKMQHAWNDVVEAYKQLNIAERSIDQAAENLRLERDFYEAGTTTMSDLLEAQMLYQQARDRRTEAFANYQNSILAYRQAVGQ